MDFFYVDIRNNILKTWSDLLTDLGQLSEYSCYCQESDFYSIFKQIIASILLEREIVLLDSDFSIEEKERLLGKSIFVTNTKVTSLLGEEITTKEALLERFIQVGPSWKIILFTSGTTGLPKRVSHSFQSITRFVKKSEKHREDVWGYAYNPTHMAGIQVFFQALLNGNSIIRLFGLPKEQIFQSISAYSISNISATPTFYRLLLPASDQYPTVNRLTSGGEKFDEHVSVLLTQVFPNAKVINVYASTEAGTLLAARGNEFSIKDEFVNMIKIEDNELMIHKSLMGGISEVMNSDWYPTGDVVEIVSENPMRFKFLARKNEMINVGGYKVNPTEVEEVIRDIRGVTDVRVFARRNSVLGNIICCEVVKNDSTLQESDIRNQLRTKLQEFKIPRMIGFVEKLSITRTGKIKRN